MKETKFETKQSETESDVISFYDSYANTWDSRFGESYSTQYFLKRRWMSFLDVLQRNNVNPEMGLELGVGTGVYISDESMLFNKLIAVDGSGKMLKLLNEKLSSKKITNVATIQSNVLSISAIEDSSVDCIFFFGLIEHILDIDEFIKELKRILKVGGVVIGVTPNGRSPWYRLRALIRGTGKHCSTDRYYTLTEINKLFTSYEFQASFHMHWGAVPGGVGNSAARILSKLEPLIEKSPLNCYLGGLTFSYRKL